MTDLERLIKARATLDGRDAVTWFTGGVHSLVVGERSQPLFGFEGFNVARAVPVDGGFDLLTREAAFYLDASSRSVLDRWKNPLTGVEVDVVHVWNDPVNQRLREGELVVPMTGIGDDLYFNLDVFLTYPSPLSRAEFPENSQSDIYQAAELFQFFCSRSEIEDTESTSASCRVSWTRIAPWLPFMEMGDRPGQLVYHCRGLKLPGGFAELPSWIRDEVAAHDEKFSRAPEEFSVPNETSWTYFRKLSERR